MATALAARVLLGFAACGGCAAAGGGAAATAAGSAEPGERGAVCRHINEEGVCQAGGEGGGASPGVAMIQARRPDLSRLPAASPVDAEVLARGGAGRSLAQEGAAGGAARRGATLEVASFNLFWWHVKQNNDWGELFARISSERPFDLIGFQECEDVASVVRGSGLGGFDFFQGPNKPDNNPCPIAWNREVFERTVGPDSKLIGRDKWGGRWINWVRLVHKATRASVLFINTHGPLEQCGSRELGNSWANAVRELQSPGDAVFMTGDFNCWAGTEAMGAVRKVLAKGVDGGIDFILTNEHVLGGGKHTGTPSDHPFMKGSFELPTGAGAGGGAVAEDQPQANVYRRVPGVGAWGGWCTCPDGQRYSVGDRHDGCGSLACDGGHASECERRVDPAREGWAVTCAQARAPTPNPAPPSRPVNHYRKAAKVGGWGGTCTCPDGQSYNVGDNWDGCGSLACEGGVPGPCQKVVDPSRDGMKVTCAGALAA